MGFRLTVALVLGHDLQAWVQFVALATAGLAALRWIINHYLADTLAQSEQATTQLEDLRRSVEELKATVDVLARKANVSLADVEDQRRKGRSP